MKFLETERFILRNVEEKDVDTMFDYRNNEKCSKYQRNQTRDKGEIIKMVEDRKNLDLSLKENIILAVSSKENDEILGEIVVMKKENTISFGYTISYKYQRKGIAYESLSHLMEYIHKKFPQCEFICLVDPENISSIKLLEKLGFKFIEYVEEIISNVYGKYIFN